MRAIAGLEVAKFEAPVSLLNRAPNESRNREIKDPQAERGEDRDAIRVAVEGPGRGKDRPDGRCDEVTVPANLLG